jgi:hypothetical protein
MLPPSEKARIIAREQDSATIETLFTIKQTTFYYQSCIKVAICIKVKIKGCARRRGIGKMTVRLFANGTVAACTDRIGMFTGSECLRCDLLISKTSLLHLDALRDLKRINNHLIASAAYSVLETKGALLPSRLRQDD